MRKQMNLIRMNHNFRKSVNLQLDLGDMERIESYIPTHSSIAILERYLESVAGKTSENATILIGPYGKGKSHLLLVLLAMLHAKKEELSTIFAKMEKVDEEATKRMKKLITSKRYLPVLVSGNAGEDLNQAFIFALREALHREKLEELAPESYYSEAVARIENWEKVYPDTYHQLEEMLALEKSSVIQLQTELNKQKKEALEQFRSLYPKLTSGNRFEPLLQQEAMKVYQQVNRSLQEEYGYSGMFLVFDEFSKYLEGHETATFSKDMKILQEMCELANAGKEGQLLLTLVAHKSIHEYVRGLDRDTINAFRGVEGRIREIEFVVSAQNNYELIADTILKKEPEFSKEFEKLQKETQYQKLMQESRSLPCFSKLFSEEDFERVLMKGCFPLTPVTAYALLRISEKVAQNERTIFTFLADEGQGSLSWLLKNGQNELVGVDKIYDYFKGLFRENNDQQQIHAEWLVAEYALARVETEEERKVIKAMAVIRMIHREEELPAQKLPIRLGLAMDAAQFEEAMQSLVKKELVVYRSSQGVYGFRKIAGTGLEEKIAKAMAAVQDKISLCQDLQKVSDLEYELPKKYNQEYTITRYFQYEFMMEEDFFQLTQTKYLFDEAFSDGKLLLLLSEDASDAKQLEEKKRAVQQHLEELGDIRVLALLSELPFTQRENLVRLSAIETLKKDEGFIEDNDVLLQELYLYEEDLIFEINAALEEAFLAENKNVWILRARQEAERGTTKARMNQMLSAICEEYYEFSPRVNHELLNIQEVQGNYLRARNAVIRNLLEDGATDAYRKGTNPEALVYRAAFLNTKEDAGCRLLCEKIDEFFADCAGEKKIFIELYRKLQGEGLGARKGIIPLFIAKKLAMVEGTPVIYLRNKELELSPETLNNINEFPEKYQLYIEPETAAKNQYLAGLEKIFCASDSLVLTKKKRISGIVTCMQRWYRSLPQYTMVTQTYPEHVSDAVKGLRNLLKRAELNPHELLFEKMPQALGVTSYGDARNVLEQVMQLMNEKLTELNHSVAEKTKEVFAAEKKESLNAILHAWYRGQSEAAKTHVLSTNVNRFMNYLQNLTTNDEEEIVADLSKIVMDMYLEDWNDNVLVSYEEELKAIKEEIEQLSSQGTQVSGKNRIILKDADGNEMERCFDADITDSTSVYLKNMIEEALDDFGDTLEMNQKVAVLVQTLEKLIQ